VPENSGIDFSTQSKDTMREVLTPLLEEKITHLVKIDDPDPITDKKYYKDKLSTWVFSPSPDPRSKQTPLADTTPEDELMHNVRVYSGPPRSKKPIEFLYIVMSLSSME